MRYVAAYVLAVMGGNESPTEEDVRQIVTSVGIDVDETQLELVMKSLRGKDLEEMIAQNIGKLAVSGVFQPTITQTPMHEGEKTEDSKKTILVDDNDSDSDDGSILIPDFWG